jgi:hypothetical protein
MAAASPLNREAGVIGGAKSEGFSRLQLAPAGAEHGKPVLDDEYSPHNPMHLLHCF